MHIGTCFRIGEYRIKNVIQIHANLYKNQPNIVQVKYNILTGFLVQGLDFLPIIGKLSYQKYLEQPIQVDELENYEKPCNLTYMSLIL